MQEPEQNQPEQTDDNDFLSKYVGEDKKYRDVNDLAKAYDHADSFITHLTRQNEELKEELEKRMSLEDFINHKNQPDSEPAQPEQVDPTPSDNTSEATAPKAETQDEPKLDESDLIKRIKEELRRDDEQQKAQTNVEQVQTRLLEVYGEADKVNEAVKNKAAEMGVSVDFLKDAAAKSPAAFYGLMGLNQDSTKPSAPKPAVNTAGLRPADSASGDPKPGTKAYFDKIRREDPRRYFRRDTQLELYKAAMANPAEFNINQS